MPTHVGPAQFILNPGTGDEFIIGREDQLEDASLTINERVVDHKSQESAIAVDQSFSGLEASATISIGNTTLEYLANVLNGKFVIDATDPAKKKLELRDLAGLRLTRKMVLVKPYDGSIPSLNPIRWITFLSAGFRSESDFTFGRETQQAYTLNLQAFPDPVTRIKVVFGDISASAIATPDPTPDPTPTPDGGTVDLSSADNSQWMPVLFR